MCGTFHYIYNLASFMILSRTSPLTHVVIHTLRRVVVILVCVAYFGNPMTPLNWVGVVVVTVAVLAYTFSKQVCRLCRVRRPPLYSCSHLNPPPLDSPAEASRQGQARVMVVNEVDTITEQMLGLHCEDGIGAAPQVHLRVQVAPLRKKGLENR